MKKKILIGVLLINFGILGILLSREEKIEQVYQEENIELAVYVENVKQDTIPSKGNEENYMFEKAICYTNGKEDPNITVTWNNSLWGPLIKGLTAYKTRCDLYFKKMSFNEAILACNQNKNAAECFLENASLNSTELAYDETADNNLRYFGANPNNYVSFNNELWRIIGVMNNIEDGSGKKETKIKLVRNESIGSYVFDGSSSNGYGNPDWATSDLMRLLNPGYESQTNGGSLYWNRTSGKCYIGSIEYTWPYLADCDFSNSGLTEEAKNYISKSLWNYGTTITTTTSTANHYYEGERSNYAYPESNSIEWIGNVAIASPSDFGFATGNSESVTRDYCLSLNLRVVDPIDSNCLDYNWMFSNQKYWLLNASHSMARFVTYVSNAQLSTSVSYDPYEVYPSVYLKSNIKIVSGNGSQSNPFKLSL